MENRNSGANPFAMRRMIRAVGATAVLGLLLSGCSASAAPPASEMAALEQTELHFSLDQCERLEANLYKCPAVDKPVCSPDYNGQLECVRVGAKGNVFVAEALE